MNINQASKHFKVSEGTLYNYLSDNLVYGAKKDKMGRWIIPDNSLKPYKIRKGSKLIQERKIIYILKALDFKQSITKEHLEDDNLLDYFDLLEEADLIKRVNISQGDPFRDYLLTLKGIAFLKDSKGYKKLESSLMNILNSININLNVLF